MEWGAERGQWGVMPPDSAKFIESRLRLYIAGMKKLMPLFLLLTFALPVRAQSTTDWPMWRGPAGDGHSGESGIPLRWSRSENVAWKAPIAGKGHSSPIVWGDRIFLTTAVEEQQKRMLLCLSRVTGKSLWERQVLVAPLEQKHSLNNYASATPATDGQRVYAAFLDRPNVRAVAGFAGNVSLDARMGGGADHL